MAEFDEIFDEIPEMSDEKFNDTLKLIGPIDNLAPTDAFNLGVAVGQRLAIRGAMDSPGTDA